MTESESAPCRLCLVTPPGVTADDMARLLEEALSGGDVASLVIAGGAEDLESLADALIPIAQSHDVAAIILNDIRLAGRADGIHVDGNHTALTAASHALRPEKIVGAGGLRSRHDAMLAGEVDPDYVFFGALDGDRDATIFDKALKLAEWWAGLFQIPAMVMGGSAIGSVVEARDAGIEFVALRSAIWTHPDGPRAAVAEANRMLAAAPETIR